MNNELARQRRGLVLNTDLGTHPGRAALRRRLESVQRGAYVAATQPIDLRLHLEALVHTIPHREWVVMSEGALWLYELADPPEQLFLGIALGHKLRVDPPLHVRRVAASVLEGSRPLAGCRAVSLEVAVIQAAETWTALRVRELVEDLVRSRRTTLTRLRARCRRGLAGSARVRGVCDELAGGSMEVDVRRLRQALEVLGVTDLEVEVHFEGARGRSAYADLLHRPTMTVIEVDGLVEHSRRARFRADRQRDRWMRRRHAVTTLRVDVLEIREDVAALAMELAWFLLREAESVESA
jgi:hypothetical protein